MRKIILIALVLLSFVSFGQRAVIQGVTGIEVEGGTTVHSSLSNLDYASSGHTGFATTTAGNTFGATQTIYGSSQSLIIANTNASSTGFGLNLYNSSIQSRFQVGYNESANNSYLWNPTSIPMKFGINNAAVAQFTTVGSFELDQLSSQPSGATTGFGGFYVYNNKPYFVDPANNHYDLTAGGTSVSFGTDNQIPYTNSGGTDFDYSANLVFDGTNLTVAGSVTSDENRVQSGLGTSGSVTLNYQSGAKSAITLSGNIVLTITNLPDGGEGTIEITNPSTYSFDLDGATGYTTEVIKGANATIKSNSGTTVAYWRIGSTLYYGFIYNN